MNDLQKWLFLVHEIWHREKWTRPNSTRFKRQNFRLFLGNYNFLSFSVWYELYLSLQRMLHTTFRICHVSPPEWTADHLDTQCSYHRRSVRDHAKRTPTSTIYFPSFQRLIRAVVSFDVIDIIYKLSNLSSESSRTANYMIQCPHHLRSIRGRKIWAPHLTRQIAANVTLHLCK